MRLLSSDRASTGKKQRPQRVVLAYNEKTGEFDQDVAWGMAERGWGLWFTVPSEASMSSLYRAAIEGAQQRRVGMWNPELCGSIEQPEASLSLRISRGNGNVADETVTVRNTGGTTVDLTGWMLRDAGNAGWYTFPGGSVLTPVTTERCTPAREVIAGQPAMTSTAIARVSSTSIQVVNPTWWATAHICWTAQATSVRGANIPAPSAAARTKAWARW